MSAQASWVDWWKTPDQQGAALLMKEPKLAAERFENPEWKAVAEYRSGNYQAAASQWNALQSHYNQGNALARLGDYPEAIKAYESALKINPKDDDAAYNKALLEKLLKQQKQQQQQQTQQQQQKNQSASSSQSNEQKNQPDKPQDSKPESSPKSSQENAQQAKLAKQEQEKQQAEQQWLNQVQDDQAGLLQRKFYRDHQRYLEQGHFD